MIYSSPYVSGTLSVWWAIHGSASGELAWLTSHVPPPTGWYVYTGRVLSVRSAGKSIWKALALKAKSA